MPFARVDVKILVDDALVEGVVKMLVVEDEELGNLVVCAFDYEIKF